MLETFGANWVRGIPYVDQAFSKPRFGFLTEDSVEKLLVQQEHASNMQSETVETLQKLNQTFQFLLSVSESSRDQLNWIQGLVANTGECCLVIKVIGSQSLIETLFFLYREKDGEVVNLGPSRLLLPSGDAPPRFRSGPVLHSLDLPRPGARQLGHGSAARSSHGASRSSWPPLFVLSG